MTGFELKVIVGDINNTNMTFLAFLYKTDNKAFKVSAKNKVTSNGNHTHNTNLQKSNDLSILPLW